MTKKVVHLFTLTNVKQVSQSNVTKFILKVWTFFFLSNFTVNRICSEIFFRPSLWDVFGSNHPWFQRGWYLQTVLLLP